MLDQEVKEYVDSQIERLASRVIGLDIRLAEAEERPREILEEIERIWRADPEAQNHE
jgi:hypothetical protein